LAADALGQQVEGTMNGQRHPGPGGVGDGVGAPSGGRFQGRVDQLFGGGIGQVEDPPWVGRQCQFGQFALHVLGEVDGAGGDQLGDFEES
jgi:hypothetical protein